MKLKTFLISAMPVVGTTLLATSFLASCNHDKTLELSNNQKLDGTKYFGMGGNFNQGTNYIFTANMNTWDEDHGKPSTAEWPNKTNIGFVISKETTGVELVNTNNIQIVNNGVILTKGTQWTLEESSSPKSYTFKININQASINLTSTVQLKNIQFASTTSDAIIEYKIIES